MARKQSTDTLLEYSQPGSPGGGGGGVRRDPELEKSGRGSLKKYILIGVAALILLAVAAFALALKIIAVVGVAVFCIAAAAGVYLFLRGKSGQRGPD